MSSINTETSNPISNKKEKCHIGKFTLFYDDFHCGFQPTECHLISNNSPYSFVSLGSDLISNDGQIIPHTGCLTINSAPYMFTSPISNLDHFKFFARLKRPFNVPVQGEIVFESILSLLQTGTTPIPESIVGGTGVYNINSDLRLASGKFSIMDPETKVEFGFLLTNEDIYLSYELPSGFMQTVPLAKRNVTDPLNDFVKLAVGYNKHHNYVRWSLNDLEVYRINRLGFPLQRNTRIIEYINSYQLITPERLLAGFGTVSFMNGYQPQNPGGIPNAGLLDFNNFEVNPLVTAIDGSSIPANFMALYNSAGFNGSNYGQGAILRMKYFTIYLLAPEPQLGIFPNLSCCHQALLLSRCEQNEIPGVHASDNLYQYQCRGFIDNYSECTHSQCHHSHSYQSQRYHPTDDSETETRTKIRKQLESLL